MVAGEHYQHDWLIVDPKNTGIVRDEGLTVPGFMGHANSRKIVREAIINLLFLHDREKLLTGLRGDKIAHNHHLQKPADLAGRAMAEIMPASYIVFPNAALTWASPYLSKGKRIV